MTKVETAALVQGQVFARIGLSVLFLVAVWIFTSTQGLTGQGLVVSPFVVAAAVIGGYMAMNIGANDVANNVGPAVGSKALTLTGAIIIAAIFEAGGALIAGGDVVSTIKSGIIDPSLMPDAATFMTSMMAALLAAALWLNLATYLGAPVSTTHAIVGGVMGAGIAATGFGAVNWPTMSKIAASWVISPLMGGIIAAAFLYFLKVNVLHKVDKIKAAEKWVPLVVAVMAGAFTMYIMNKGIKHLYKSSWTEIVIAGVVVYALAWFASRARVRVRSKNMENRRKSVNALFVMPLIISAALLSFAHGANDVANAVGPLAAIVSAADSGQIVTKAGIPLWVMLVGAVGISIGLMLFGPRLIKTVGQEITKLNPVRAFCVALSAAITVIIASALGLPVSSTHIAVGGVFGVGFLREYLAHRETKRNRLSAIAAMAVGTTEGLHAVENATPELQHMPKIHSEQKARNRMLVRRQHAWTIAAAWIITVPLAAALAAGLYFIMMALGVKP
ncbi:inorganic phosphate transporter [Magnetovibrio blakemorei]|uniref:Phosphate transporter n=1 Tax=Magnetovibrio blakemorei TaxID=28181 RepID=A0A1E5Q3P9_9PROT|nr:inorganic phosphate transporter [Magnetovibrio blakemorei]